MEPGQRTRFKKLIGSATDFGTFFVFCLRIAIHLKSLRFGVEYILETQTNTMKITCLLVRQSNAYIFQMETTFSVVHKSPNYINGDYLFRGHSTAAATIANGYYLSRSQVGTSGYARRLVTLVGLANSL